MKHIARIALPGLVSVSLIYGQSPTSQHPFEGIIEFKMQDLMEVVIFDLFVKGDRMMMQSHARNDARPTFIWDFGGGKLITFVTATEKYLERPYTPSAPTVTEEMPDIKATEERETIAGLPSDLFIVRSDEAEIEVWATKTLGALASIGNPNRPTKNLTWQQHLRQQGYTITRMVWKDASGYETGRWEILKVTRRAVPESVFRIPRGFQKVENEQELFRR
jgi:hypothetical protein